MSNEPKRCRQCQTIISQGRNYCNPHYQEALIEHQEDLRIYENNKAKWDLMDDEGRARWDRHAEANTLNNLAGLFGFASGVLAWYAIVQTTEINNLLGLLLIAVTTTLSVIIKPLRNIVAKFTRIIIAAVVMHIFSVIVLFILFAIGDFLEDEDIIYPIFFGAILIAAIVAIVLEVKGKLKSSGEPMRPSAPTA
ncbi:MAG: hypothetical protein MJK10_12020 [Pseudomonadales bacterium]|nr:hypothetical protein [Pseudomonadales bacterium]NRA16660.1 hypothetical protein [Oceanospirillaceae bacterium]